MRKKANRLFSEFQPSHYNLTLKIDREAMSFQGSVAIRGRKVNRPSQRFVFHQNNLKITEASITVYDKKGSQPIAVSRINQHRRFQEVRLHTVTKLYPGEYSVHVGFSGEITRNMSGIYPSFFTHQGKEKAIIATQFESHYAREVFPCIDEPEAKATFDLSLITAPNDTVLSNTPIMSEKKNSREKITVFETTPRMSSYLLAFAIGELHFVEGRTKNGTLIRSWCSAARPKEFLDYSLEEATKILEFFEDYFGISYPLAKCDQVALPDFDSGAMENWGLITYREVALLADPKNRSISNEQYISLVIAHELSHQWFGNLVTMKWWDDLWLNESFASLMEYIALDAIHPEWHYWESYAATDIVQTSSRDVYKDIQPVGVQVADPDLLETLFDPGIVYAKGARLLKMLRDYLGDEAFRNGLKLYFQRLAYQNATREDLWRALSEASDQDISTLMTPWITQSGMPLLQVKQNGRILTLTQNRFLLEGADSEQTLWPIPLLADNQLDQLLFTERKTVLQAAEPRYTLFNRHGSGHYLVQYLERAHRDYLAKRINALLLPPATRINIINDTYMLARQGGASLVDALDMVNNPNENRDAVWTVMTRTLSAATQLTEGDEVTEVTIKRFKQTLAQTWYEVLGWTDQPTDDANMKQLRRTAIALMVGGERDDVLLETEKRLQKVKNLQNLPAELRAVILTGAVKRDDKATVERLLKDYATAIPDIQADITAGLGVIKDAQVATRVIHRALGPKGFVRPQDVMRWLVVFLRNRHTREVMWQFMENEWTWLEQTIGKSKSFDFLPVHCAAVITTENWSTRYKQFFQPKENNKILQRNIFIGYSDIAARVAWRKRDEAVVKQWLRRHVS